MVPRKPSRRAAAAQWPATRDKDKHPQPPPAFHLQFALGAGAEDELGALGGHAERHGLPQALAGPHDPHHLARKGPGRGGGSRQEAQGCIGPRVAKKGWERGSWVGSLVRKARLRRRPWGIFIWCPVNTYTKPASGACGIPIEHGASDKYIAAHRANRIRVYTA